MWPTRLGGVGAAWGGKGRGWRRALEQVTGVARWQSEVASHQHESYPKGCAAPEEVQYRCNAREPLSKLERTSPHRKINVTSKSPVGDIPVVTLIRTDTTLDHSQKAEKVCAVVAEREEPCPRC